jgi:hypothetical protein
MTGLRWQKSSYSEGGADTCVEVALDETGTPRLRESASPGTVVTASPSALAALLDLVKSSLRQGS